MRATYSREISCHFFVLRVSRFKLVLFESTSHPLSGCIAWRRRWEHEVPRSETEERSGGPSPVRVSQQTGYRSLRARASPR